MKKGLKNWTACTGILLLFTLVGVTSAYFSDYARKENPVAVGTNTIQIKEEFPEQTPIPDDDGGEKYKKVVYVSNLPDGLKDYNVDCYVRVALSYSNYDVGRAVRLLNLDTTNWIYNAKDEYYYYRHPLKEGEKTTALFTGFEIFPEKVEAAYRDLIDDFEINIYTESIGKGKGESYAQAWEKYAGV